MFHQDRQSAAERFTASQVCDAADRLWGIQIDLDVFTGPRDSGTGHLPGEMVRLEAEEALVEGRFRRSAERLGRSLSDPLQFISNEDRSLDHPEIAAALKRPRSRLTTQMCTLAGAIHAFELHREVQYDEKQPELYDRDSTVAWHARRLDEMTAAWEKSVEQTISDDRGPTRRLANEERVLDTSSRPRGSSHVFG